MMQLPYMVLGCLQSLDWIMDYSGMDYGILCTAESTISHCILAFLSTLSEESPLIIAGKATSYVQNPYVEAK